MNVLFVGSKEEIDSAFLAAGWTRAKASTFTHSTILGVRAVAEGHNNSSAPMSHMIANDREPDMLWEKGQNDSSKRHHVRIWKQDSTWNGQQLWIGAATRDVDFAFLRRGGGAMTHRIAQDVDQERDKIAHDFEFTACTDVVDWWDRPGAPTAARNGTGDLMETDGRLAVVRLNRCTSPRVVDDSDSEPLPARPNAFQASGAAGRSSAPAAISTGTPCIGARMKEPAGWSWPSSTVIIRRGRRSWKRKRHRQPWPVDFSHAPATAVGSVKDWSGRRESNSQPTAWKAVTLPLSYSRPSGRRI